MAVTVSGSDFYLLLEVEDQLDREILRLAFDLVVRRSTADKARGE